MDNNEHEDELQDPSAGGAGEPDVASGPPDVAADEDEDDDEEDDDEEDDDEEDDDDDEAKGIKTSTKVVLVAAAWLLLTLFLVGKFSEDGEQQTAGRLDAVAGADLDGDGEPDEVVEEEATDANGDGIIEIGEGIWEAGGASGIGVGGDAGGSESPAAEEGSGSATYSATPTDPGSGPSAVPGAAPGGSTVVAPDSGGGAGATTPTTSGPGGSGGGSGGGGTATTTTTSGGGGGGDTTTTTAQAPPPSSPVIFIVQARNNQYVYPQGYGSGFSIPARSKIRFDNDEPENSTKHRFTIVGGWDSGDVKRNTVPVESPELTPGTYSYGCKYHPSMQGTFTVS